ncbi:hypothetical protein QE152_g7265 [Popillia japonica]|uniref:Endonuclease/exonuclease/phosphatase domain-containing protein n=1 Tax=Popillia japonica TaxID=7064 RepID=A0AAW1MFM2_POPJA
MGPLRVLRKGKSSNNMKILQANLRRGRAGHDIAYASAKEIGADILIVGEPNKNTVRGSDWSADILIVGEPNKNTVRGSDWIKDRKGDVAILFFNKRIVVLKVKPEEGYVYLRFKEYAMYCCYISPNITFDEFQGRVYTLMNSIHGQNEEALVLGDINAKSNIRQKGRTLGNIPTFRRGDCTSYIDVTCSTQNIARNVKNWKVLEKENLSDHAYIFFEVSEGYTTKKHLRAEAVACDWDAFTAELELTTLGLTEARKPLHEQYSKIIKEAYRNSTRRVSNAKPAPYWWNEAIDDKRRQCTSARRYLMGKTLQHT